MNVDRANTMLAQAARILEHSQGRTKADAQQIEQVRQLVDAAIFALQTGVTAPLPEPIGARSGISTQPRAEWRR